MRFLLLQATNSFGSPLENGLMQMPCVKVKADCLLPSTLNGSRQWHTELLMGVRSGLVVALTEVNGSGLIIESGFSKIGKMVTSHMVENT